MRGFSTGFLYSVSILFFLSGKSFVVFGLYIDFLSTRSPLYVSEVPLILNVAFVPLRFFLTAKKDVSDRVRGLNLGADDYISKPFHVVEVVARIKTLIVGRMLPKLARFTP